MSKKHFVQLADAIRQHNGRPGSTYFTNGQIETLADFCYAQNPRFNRDRWFRYIKGECGPNGGCKKTT